MTGPALVIARLTWTRLLRGRAIYVTALLAVLPILMAALSLTQNVSDTERWRVAAETAVRFLATLAPAVHLSNAVGEEVEGKTYTYLWSRPFPRPALLFGKLIAVLPVVIAAVVASLTISFLVVYQGDAGAHTPALGHAMVGGIAGAIAAGAFSVGVGALLPRHPFVFTLAYFLIADQVLWMVPNVGKISILFHVRQLADLPSKGIVEDGLDAIVWLAGIVVVCLAVGIWRVRVSEYAKVDT